MRLSIRYRRGARVWGIVGSVGLLTTAFCAVIPGVANATPGGYEAIFLSNAAVFMGPEADAAGATVAADRTGIWLGQSAGTTNEDGISGTGYTFEYNYDSTNGDLSGLCLADTGGDASLEGCSADGTVFIPVQNGDGDFLYSRYYLNLGKQEVLAVYNPYGAWNGVYIPLQVVPVSELNSSWWYRWGFESGSQ